MKARQEADKRERATHEIQESKANKNLKPFGAEKAKFEAPQRRG